MRSARPAFLLIALATLLCLGCGDGNWKARKTMEGPPNIVFFLVDDLRHDELGYAGYPVATPNIDALAASGARFENAFVTSSLCSPSRASFLTGVYPHTHGVVGNLADLDLEKTPSIALALQAQGYRTGLVGKWHMGASSLPRPGFDHWIAVPGQGRYYSPTFNVGETTTELKGYNTDLITEMAMQFIEDARGHPFYLHIRNKGVHDPASPARRHERTLNEGDFDLKAPTSADSQAPLRQLRAETLLSVDESIGMIMKFLEALGLRNTILVFASDNGFLFGEHGLNDKRVFYEESIRIPWVVAHPTLVTPGTVVDEHVLNIDFMPSMLALAGVPVPAHVQGRSFAPLLAPKEGEMVPWRDYWVYEYFNELEFFHIPTQLAVRDERYKYVRFPEGPSLFGYFTGEDLLFDLEQDPFEQQNLAASPEHGDVLQRMRGQLQAFADESELRFFDLDPEALNQRIDYLYNVERLDWFREALDKKYPEGYPGWTQPERGPL